MEVRRPVDNEGFIECEVALFRLELRHTEKAASNSVWIEARIGIDDEHCVYDYPVDLIELVDSLVRPGEFFVLTCQCGEPGCTGLFTGILVTHGTGRVRWTVVEPAPRRTLCFDRRQMVEAIWNWFSSANTRINQSERKSEFVPTSFQLDHFHACCDFLKWLRTSGDCR